MGTFYRRSLEEVVYDINHPTGTPSQSAAPAWLEATQSVRYATPKTSPAYGPVARRTFLGVDLSER